MKKTLRNKLIAPALFLAGALGGLFFLTQSKVTEGPCVVYNGYRPIPEDGFNRVYFDGRGYNTRGGEFDPDSLNVDAKYKPIFKKFYSKPNEQFVIGAERCLGEDFTGFQAEE